MIIYEVSTHLFKKKESRKLKVNLVSSVEGKNNEKLRHKKMEKQMKHISECSVTRLLNGVNHVWSKQITLVTDGSLKKATNDSNLSSEQNIINCEEENDQ